MSNAYHSFVKQSNVRIVECEGNWLLGYAGHGVLLKRWLDFWGDEGVSSVGCSSFLRNSIENFLSENRPIHVPKMYGDYAREELARKLIEFTKLYGYKVMFSNSGTEANELAIKAARLFYSGFDSDDRKYDIYSFRKNFHGRTAFSLAASDSYGSGSPYHKDGFGPMPKGFYHFTEDSYAIMRKNKDIAAVMLATILGNNEIEVYSNDFFKRLQAVVKDTKSLLILDEIQVGMGRTGVPMAFHAFDLNPLPDIVTIGKGIAGGFPLSATIMRPDIAEKLTYGKHFNTTSGNSLISHVAIDVIDRINSMLPTIYGNGRFFADELEKRFDWIKEVHGRGLHLAIEIKTEDYGEYNYDSYDFCNEAIRYGLLIVSHRKYGQIRLTPPLTITRGELEFALNSLEDTHEALKNR